MQTQEQTNTTAPITNVNLTGLPIEGAAVPQLNLVPQPTAEELAMAKAKQDEAEAIQLKADQAKRDTQMALFVKTTGFALEVEVVGAPKPIKRTMAKNGSVKMSLAPRKELTVLSGGLKGGDLDNWARMEADKLKNEQSLLATRLASDNNWTGKEMVVNKVGNEITIKYRKVAPITVGLAEPTEAQAAAKFGVTVEEMKAFLAMKAASAKAAEELAAKAAVQAEQDAKAQAELEAEQNALDASKSDNDTE